MDLKALMADYKFIIFGIAIIAVIGLYLKWRKTKLARRIAIKELNSIRERYAKNLDNKRFIYEINLLLRRISVNNFSRQQVESLTGDEWLAFLDATGNTHEFSQGSGKVLAHGAYNFEAGELNTGAVYALVKKWIKIQT